MPDFSEALSSGRFLITTEQTPPKGADLSGWLERVKVLQGRVDAVNLTESSGAVMTMSPIGAVPGLQAIGLPPILQLTCRDRNRIALQADLLAASALGVTSIVAMSGDLIEGGDHPQSQSVFDLDTIGLLTVAGMLNRGSDMMGNELRGAPRFTCGAVVNPGATDLDLELRRMEQKVEAGARFFQTQAVYDPSAFERFMVKAGSLGVPVLAGFIVLKSAAMAQRLNRSLPGVRIPNAIIRELEEATDRRAASIDVSCRILRTLSDMCQGLHIIAVGWEASIPEILAGIGLKRE
jgi:methylenetetrahydrofolate reductase (NADPH)